MEIDTKGRVVVKVRIENLADLYVADKGKLRPEQVRAIEVDDALVDPGARVLFIPRRLIKKLGLKKLGTQRIRTAAGHAIAGVYDAVRLTIQGRECTIDVADVPNDCPVLIGKIPLVMLDFVVDLQNQKLIGNPEHGGEQIIDAF
jgi:predicted aspartyl protease